MDGGPEAGFRVFRGSGAGDIAVDDTEDTCYYDARVVSERDWLRGENWQGGILQASEEKDKDN